MNQDRVNMLVLQRENSWDKEEWIVPLAAALQGVTTHEATWTPQGGGNTIWQTVRHINYYNERILNRLTDRPVSSTGISNDETFGLPGDAEDHEGWQETLKKTETLVNQLLAVITALTDADLDKSFGSETLGAELSRWTLHDAYHSGQIVLIRKQMGTWRV
ncbi:DinB family protein [Paenibacillus sp. TY11]|uniref:DinB family protein n=1 Tax=Paenibacillus sp. TY11 TaxID=3448633 RepID=UPI004039E8CC